MKTFLRMSLCCGLVGSLFADTTQLLARQQGSATPEDLAAAEHRLAKQLSATRNSSDALSLSIRVRGRRYVRLVRAGLLPLGLGLDALIDHAAKVERLHSALKVDLTALRKVQQRRIDIGKQLEAIQARRAVLDAQWGRLANGRDAIRSSRRRAEAFRQAFLNSRGADHTTVYSPGLGPSDASFVDPDPGRRGFSRLKGRLPFPLPGRTEIRTAAANAPRGHALSMRGRAGAPVRAVASGRVAFADDYPEYGLTVILDHGDDFFTVSAHLGSLDVRAGDEIAAGSRIATLGSDGTLHFEVRKNMDALDPADWFGI